jgi:hypothetical protein
MSIYRLTSTILLSLIMMAMTRASANDISVTSAHAIANEFIKQHATNAPGSFKSPAAADIKLVHAEPSSKVEGSNVYYAFNIKGGGFIIIAGDDRASRVLGYSDKDRIDFNHLPDPLEGLLDHYKYEIEYVQTHHLDKSQLGFRTSLKDASVIVEPMTTSTWGQENPYYLQTPVYNNSHSRVGCSGICMSQIVYFWKYPETCGPFPSYYNSTMSANVPELPETTFDFSKMLDAYCHWDWDLSMPVLDDFTDEQLQEATKLCRYMGQAAQMRYSPSMTIAIMPNVFAAMKDFGYNPNAQYLKQGGYTTEVWEGFIRTDLDASRPVMYTAFSQNNSVGHTYVIDGYDNEGFFHINMGWYGTNDGWYQMSAVTLINRYGEYRDYSHNAIMFLGIEPPAFCTLKAADVDANNGLIVLGGNLYPEAHSVNLYTSYRELDLMFTLTDANGQIVATGEPQRIIRHRFVQGCDIELPLTLPTQLASGTYYLNFAYSIANEDNSLVNVVTAPGKLVVVGKLAKYNAAFDIEDVTQVINYILNGSGATSGLDISDVTELIEHVLK